MAGDKGFEADSGRGRGRAAVVVITWLVAAVFVWKMARIILGRVETGRASDFYYFWDAGANVLAGHAARAYTTHAIPGGFLWPLPHPPPFLLLAAPLALLPLGVSLALFLGITGLAYVLTARQPLRIALANPTAPYNVRWAQTGFLTSSILFGGLNWLRKRPLVSGAVLGLMVIKPHLAVFIPLALAAGRHWKSLAAAAASVAAQIVITAIAFGPAIYVAWWKSITHFAQLLDRQFWRWSDLSSTYGFLRWWGLGSPAALTGQALTAVAGALLVFQSWRHDWSSKGAVLAAATLLVPPYLGADDAVMMVVPLGLIAARSAWRGALLWFLLLVPWFNPAMINSGRLPFDVAGWPDTTPIAAALALYFLWIARQSDQSTLRIVSS